MENWRNIEQVRADVSDWEADNLDETGRYTGRDLRRYGFPWSVGQWCPVDNRYSAMIEHRAANRCRIIMGGNRESAIR